jgi:hypothetical protein
MKAASWIVNDIKIRDTPKDPEAWAVVSYPRSTVRMEYIELIERRADGLPLHPRRRSGWRCTCERCT